MVVPPPHRYDSRLGRCPTGPNQPLREETMKTWRKPKVRELSVGTEINAYACARL